MTRLARSILATPLAIGLALSVMACTRPATLNAPPPPPQHVFVITIDTLRADRLGCYGDHRAETPNMDRLARDGAMAIAASAPVPLTRPSHVSIFTGLSPAEHGIRDNISRALAGDVPTLAEAFKAAGFDTAAFVSSIVLSRQSGLARGFDEYSDRFDLGPDAGDEARFLDILEKRGDVAVTDATTWLEQHAQRRTFVWIHLYDPHAPYEPPEPYASKFADRPYDGEVAWSDELVGRLDRTLTRLGIRDASLVALTSDHGESLGEHGEAVHGFFLYEATLHVPLILRGPGVPAGTRLQGLVRSVDLFPTILELSGLPLPQAPHAVSGRSFAAAARGGTIADAPPAFAESLTPRIHYGWSDLHSIRDGRWKFILAPKPELYDLNADPGELHNLVEREPARTRALRRALDDHLSEEAAGARHPAVAGDVPSDLVERLAALGYASGNAQARDTTLADPKDKIADYTYLNATLHSGLLQLRDRDYAGAAARFADLAARGLDSFEAHYYYGQALVGLGRWRAAADQFDRAIPRLPGFAASYLMLAECHVAAKDRVAAIAALRRGVTAAPGDARLLRRLGELYRDTGNLDAAVASFRDAIARDPDEPTQWNSIGMILGAGGNLGEAEHAFREAVRRDPREARYTYNLALTLEREERTAEAVPLFRKTLELDRRFTDARQHLDRLER